MTQNQEIVRVNTSWMITAVLVVGAQLLLVMAVITSWMPAVYTTEAADIFLRGRNSFPKNYDLFLYRSLILVVMGITLAAVFVFKKRMSKEELGRALRPFVVMTLGWAVLGYWAAFEMIMHPATGVFKLVFSIAMAGNWLTWGWGLINPGRSVPLASILSAVSAGLRQNVWIDGIVDLGAKKVLAERMVLSVCVIVFGITYHGWLGQPTLPYFWPLRFGYVGLYTASFVVPILYLVITLIGLENLQGQASNYARWFRSLGIAGLVSFLIYVRYPVGSSFWLSLWPMIVVAVLTFWRSTIWRPIPSRVWVALLGGIELGLTCTWIQEKIKLSISPSDFATIFYVVFVAGGLVVYGVLSIAQIFRWKWQKNLASFALFQMVLVILSSMAWFKLVVYDYRGDLARFWFHWLGILILLQPLVWIVLRALFSWGRFAWQRIDPIYRVWISWTLILGFVFGASFVPNINAMTAHIFMGEYMHHTDTFVMGPAWAVANGAVINVDVCAKYGIGAVYFFLGAMNLLGGISYEHLYTAIVWICASYFVLVFVLYRQWLGNTALALAAWMMAFKAQIAFELAFPFVFTYPQSTVARQWPDIIWMILMFIFIRSGSLWALVLASLTVGFALWYMPSIGGYMIPAHAIITAMVAWRDPDWKQRIIGCLWPTGLAIISAVLMFVAICGHWFLSPVFWQNTVGFLKYFVLINTVPITDSLIHRQFLNVIVFCVIAFVYIFTIVKVGLDYLNPSHKNQADRMDWLALGLSIYGLGLLEHYVVFSMGNLYYTKTVPFFLVLFHWISRGMAHIPRAHDLWRKRLSWAIAGFAFVALVTHHGYMSYPNALNISSEPFLDKRVARPLPDGRPYFYHKDRGTIPPNRLLTFNNFGNTDESFITEYDFQDYKAMIARYHQDSDFTADARLISSLTAPQDKVVLISSYEVRILMQAKRRPFFFVFPLLASRAMQGHSLPDDMLYTKSDLMRAINDLDNEKPEYIFMEKMMSQDNIPPAYNETQPGLMALLRYVKINYSPFRAGHYLIALKRKE